MKNKLSDLHNDCGFNFQDERGGTMTFAEKIKEYAEVNGLSYFAIGKAAGMSESTVYEVVKKGVASPWTIKKIADTFGGEFSDYVIKKKCGDCGADFYPDSYRSIRCESCVERAKEWKRAHKKHGLEVECFKQPEEKKNKSIPKVNQESRAMGLSYGQFVGLQKLKEQKEENEKRYKLFILDKKRVDELAEEIAKLAKRLSYSPEEIQRIFYDKDIYAINKSKRKKARKAFVKSCIEHSYENISSMISKAEVELAFVNERIAREEEAFNSYDKLGVWRLEAVINDK